MGPAGPAGGGLVLVDNNGQHVGKLLDVFNGWVMRELGADRLLLQTTPSGFVAAPVTFVYTQANCQGAPYLYNSNGMGHAFAAVVAGDSVVYSRVVDPSYNVNVAYASFKTIPVGQPLTASVDCSPSQGSGSIGQAVIAPAGEMSNLVAPFHIE